MKKFLTAILVTSIVLLTGSWGFQKYSHETHVMNGKIMMAHDMPSVESNAAKSSECADSCFVNDSRSVFNSALFSQPLIQKFLSLLIFTAFLLCSFVVFKKLRRVRFQDLPVRVFSGIESTILRE